MESVQDPKNGEISLYSQTSVTELLKQHYGLEVLSVKNLPGYQDRNFIIQTAERKYVFKIQHPDKKCEEIKAECQIMVFLNSCLQQEEKLMSVEQGTLFRCPQLIGTLRDSQEKFRSLIFENKTYFLRLISFLQGSLMEDTALTPKLAENFGKAVGMVNKIFLTCKNEVMMKKEYLWDMKNTPSIRQYIKNMQEGVETKTIHECLTDFENKVSPKLGQLRKAILHNDMNTLNILIDEKTSKITGVIDYSDMVYSCSLFQVAIAITYGMHNAANPIEIAPVILKGVNEVSPLTGLQVQLLYTCICARNSVSVTMARYFYSLEPSNQYFLFSTKSCLRSLELLRNIGGKEMTCRFKAACGM